jgi:hypothetical protein
LALSKKFVPNEQQELVVLRGNKGDYLVPLLKSCKEPRKSLLFWEPHCIATSWWSILIIQELIPIPKCKSQSTITIIITL